MIKKSKLLYILLSFILTFNLICCNSNNEVKDNKNITITKNVEEKFNEFLDEEFKDIVTSDTLTLHYKIRNPKDYGIKDFEPTLGKSIIESIDDSEDEISDTLKKLHSFDYDQLTDDQKLTYDIYEYYLKCESKSDGLEYYYNLLSPTIGFQANIPINFAEYKFYNETDVTDYLSLLDQLDEYFDSVIEYEQKKSEKGLFMADFAVDDIVNQCTEFISNPESNCLISTFDNRINSLPDISEENKNKYKTENKKIVLESIIPCYKELIDELNKLKGTGTNEGGICNFPSGKKYYEYLVSSETGSNKDIDEIKDLLEDRLAKLYSDLNKLIIESPDVIDTFTSQTSELTDPNTILNTLMDKIAADYPEGPPTNFNIKYVDPSLEENLSPAFYMIPAIDSYKDNVIYINNNKVKDVSLFSVLAHEGYPGHLYQYTYFCSKNPTPLRQLLDFGGYSEGWATYVENHSYELADYNNDSLVRFSQIYNEICLAIPSIADIGINYDGWSLEKTTKFLNTYGYDSSIAEDLYKSLIEEPANYLQYYVGYLEFVELRDYAKEELKDKFILKDFNEVLLNVGPAPFSIIKEHVDKYIENN